MRDLPRRTVARTLASRLEAQVSLGSLQVHGAERFTLRNLTVRRMKSQPHLLELKVETLHVTGALREIMNGRFDSLRGEDLTAVIGPAPPAAEATAGAAAGPEFDAKRIEIVRGRILFGSEVGGVVRIAMAGLGENRSEETAPALDLEGTLEEVPRASTGELRLSAAHLALAPILRTFAADSPSDAKDPAETIAEALEGFEARIGIEDAAVNITARARARRAVIAWGERKLEIAEPTLDLVAKAAGDDAPLEVSGGASLSFVERTTFSGRLDPRTWRPLDYVADFEGIDAAPLLALAPLPEGAVLDGKLTLRARGVGEKLQASLEGEIARGIAPIAGGSLSVRDAHLSGNAAMTIVEDAWRAPIALSMELPSLEGTIQGRPLPAGLAPGRLALEGELAMAEAPVFEGTGRIATAELGQLEIRGRIGESEPNRGNAPPMAALDLGWRWDGIDVGRLARLLEEAGLTGAFGLALQGKGAASGTLTGTSAAPLFGGEIRLSGLEGAPAPPVDRRLTQGDGPARPVDRRVNAAPGSEGSRRTHGDAPARADGWRLTGGEARARLQWQGPSQPVIVQDLEARGKFRAPPLGEAPVALQARGEVDAEKSEARLAEARVEVANLLRAKLGEPARIAYGAVGPAEERGRVRVVLEGIDLVGWRSFVEPITGSVAPGYAIKGEVAGELLATLQGDGRWRGAGSARTVKFGASSEDGSQVLEGLDTDWRIGIDGRLEPLGLLARARASVGGFQFLWESFFADGTTLESTLELSAALGAHEGIVATPLPGETAEGLLASRPAPPPPPPPPGTRAPERPATQMRARWSFPKGLLVEASLISPAGSQSVYDVRVESDDLSAVVDRLRTMIGDSVPWFTKVRAAGSLRATARGRTGEDETTLQGRVALRGVDLEGTEGRAEINGLDLDLPLDLRWIRPSADGSLQLVRPPKGSPVDADAAGTGSLRFAGLRLMGLQIAAGETPIAVRADTLELTEPVSISVFTGALGLERLLIADILGSTRRAESGIVLASLSLAEISRSFGLLPLDGTMDAHFPKVTLNEKELQVDGGGRIDVFGGKITFGEISGEDILSRFPKLAFSADFDGIDLLLVTRTYDFGEMTGIVQGYVRDCELFRGVPTAFEARIATEERKGVRKTVNVKAIHNIAILGTGGDVSLLDRGLHKFLDKYNYKRLGVAMSLSRDELILRGLERQGDRELFLEGALPFPLNVINAQPGHPVSFEDMMERIRNLDLGTVKVQ